MYHFNIRGPLIVGAALSAITSLVHISAKRTASINGRRTLACSHEHIDATRRCTTPRYALCAKQVMNEIFDEKWIGRGSPVACPPRSPDLTSPDYFLWGFVKERVMAVAPTTPDDMKERIR